MYMINSASLKIRYYVSSYDLQKSPGREIASLNNHVALKIDRP